MSQLLFCSQKQIKLTLVALKCLFAIKQHMRKGKSPSSLLKNQKTTRLNNYASWFHSKQKSQASIKQLKAQNQKLLAKINLLEKQNSELLSYKQKYLALNLEEVKPKNQPREKQKSPARIYQTDKKYLASSFTETEQDSLLKGKNLKSARKLEYVSNLGKSPQTGIFDDQMIHKFDSSIFPKKKRFNYISDPDQIQLKATLASLSKKIDSKSIEAESILIGRIFNESIKKQKQLHKESVYQAKHVSEDELLVSTQNSKSMSRANVEVLEKQLNQMRRIQGQLLDRIQERDQIIQELKNLIIQR